jgi:hypothetical protein
MSLLKHGFTKATAPERAVVVTIVAIIYAYRDLFGKSFTSARRVRRWRRGTRST